MPRKKEHLRPESPLTDEQKVIGVTVVVLHSPSAKLLLRFLSNRLPSRSSFVKGDSNTSLRMDMEDEARTKDVTDDGQDSPDQLRRGSNRGRRRKSGRFGLTSKSFLSVPANNPGSRRKISQMTPPGPPPSPSPPPCQSGVRSKSIERVVEVPDHSPTSEEDEFQDCVSDLEALESTAPVAEDRGVRKRSLAKEEESPGYSRGFGFLGSFRRAQRTSMRLPTIEVDGLPQVREEEEENRESEEDMRRPPRTDASPKRFSALRRMSRKVSLRLGGQREFGAQQHHHQLEESSGLLRDQRDRNFSDRMRRKQRSSSFHRFRDDVDNCSHSSEDGDAGIFEREEEQRSRRKVVQMIALGNRIELVKDLGHQLSFEVYDEASVSEWKGLDFRQANNIPSMDLILLTLKKNNLTDLTSLLSSKSGMLHFLCKFWRGFYPLLIVELRAESEEGEGIFDEAQDPEFESALSHLSKFFSDVHHIQVSEDSLEEEVDWITECLARLYIHSRLYQCSRFYGQGLGALDTCPGGCGLSKKRTRPMGGKRIHRKKVKWKKRASVYAKAKTVGLTIAQ